MIESASKKSLVFDLIIDNEGLNALEDDWRALYAQSAHAPYFASFDWMLAAWECVASPNGRQLRIIVGRLGKRVILIWPLVIYQKSQARMLGSEMFEYRDLLVQNNQESDTWIDAAWCFICENLGVDTVLFLDIRDDARLYPFLDRRRLISYKRSTNCVFVDCQKYGNWDSLFERLSPSRRSELRRKERRLAEMGRLEFHEIKEDAEIDKAVHWLFDRKLEWLDNSTAQRKRPATYGGPKHRAFVISVSKKAAASGNLFFGALLLNGNMIAIVHAVMEAPILTFIYGAYDGAFRKYAPGSLATAKMIEMSFGMGMKKVDRAYADADHKFVWPYGEYQKSDFLVACSWRGEIKVAWARSIWRHALTVLAIKLRLPAALEWRLEKALRLEINEVKHAQQRDSLRKKYSINEG